MSPVDSRETREVDQLPRKYSAVRQVSVLHLIHTMAYGGVETALINWLQRIDRSRFDVHLVCFANPGATETPFVAAAERCGLHVHKIPWGRRKPLLKAARALVRLIRALRIDVLHMHNSYANFVGALAARLTPVKTITTLYVWANFSWKRNVLQGLDKYVIRCFDRITAHCEFTWRETVARGIPPDRVKTLICGFESHPVELTSEERLRRRRERGIADDHLLLASVARFYPEKAHHSLLRCFKEILRRCPKARLWIAGVGPLEQEIKAYCGELGLSAEVTFAGFVADLSGFLSLVDIQVHPAEMEGVPLALCEGMAHELPIVASDVGGIPEILDHGKSGILVSPGDEAGFIEAVMRLIQQPEEARRLGGAARQFIETEYSLNAAVRRVEQTYYEMLGLCESASSS